MGGKLSGFKVVDLVRPCNLVETEEGVKRMLSRKVEPAVTRLGNGGKMLLSCVKVEQKNSLNKFALASQSSI